MCSHVCFCILGLDANPIPLEFLDILQKDAAEPFLILLLPCQELLSTWSKWTSGPQWSQNQQSISLYEDLNQEKCDWDWW